MKKNYVLFIIVLILLILTPILILVLDKYSHKTDGHLPTASRFEPVPLPKNGNYVSEDTSVAPPAQAAAIQGEIIRETKELNNHIWQRFILNNTETGAQHVLFEQEGDNMQFEKITSQNWSPTNRFFYVFFDRPDNKRNFLIFETDGRFTDTQYYLKPVILDPSETVSQAFWKDGETLDFNITNQQNNTVKKYEVDLNDSTGVVSQI